MARTSRRADPLSLAGAAFLCVVVIEALFPPLRAVGNYAIVSFVGLAGWLLVAILRRPGFFLAPTPYRLLALFLAFATAVLPYVFQNDVIGNRYMSLLIVTLGFVVYEYYETGDQLWLLGGVLKVGVGFAAVTAVRTIIALLGDPWVSRAIKSTGAYSASLSAQGIGGYETIYFAALVCPLVLYLALESESPHRRIICTWSYLGLLLLIVLSNYLTALLVVATSSVVCISLVLVRRGRRPLAVVAASVGATVLIVYGSQAAGLAMRAIVGISPAGMNAERFGEMTDSLSTGLRDEYLADRFPVMDESIAAVLRHPVLGLSATRVTESAGFLTGFGQHSHVLDTFALFGIPLGLLNVHVLFSPFRRRFHVTPLLGLSVPFATAYVLILTFNNATPSLGVAACLMFPALWRQLSTEVSLVEHSTAHAAADR